MAAKGAKGGRVLVDLAPRRVNDGTGWRSLCGMTPVREMWRPGRDWTEW